MAAKPAASLALCLHFLAWTIGFSNNYENICYHAHFQDVQPGFHLDLVRTFRFSPESHRKTFDLGETKAGNEFSLGFCSEAKTWRPDPNLGQVPAWEGPGRTETSGPFSFQGPEPFVHQELWTSKFCHLTAVFTGFLNMYHMYQYVPNPMP